MTWGKCVYCERPDEKFIEHQGKRLCQSCFVAELNKNSTRPDPKIKKYHLKKYTFDADKMKSENEFWDHYIEVVTGRRAHKEDWFGRNWDAFHDVIQGETSYSPDLPCIFQIHHFPLQQLYSGKPRTRMSNQEHTILNIISIVLEQSENIWLQLL